MPLSAPTVNALRIAMADQKTADQIVTIVNAASGTVGQDAKNRMQIALAYVAAGNAIVAVINAAAGGSSVTNEVRGRLRVALANKNAADEILAAIP